jgi:hypothetical protein
LTLAIVLSAASNLSAAVIYAPTVIGSSARISDYGSASGTGFRTFDNFEVSFGGSVQTVTWQGFWLDLDNPIPVPAPSPDVLNWEIAFHADNAGIPGSQLSFESFAAADVASTFLGYGVFNAGGSYNVSYYEYSVTLTNPFEFSGGTEYWFSIFSRSDSYFPAFTLRGATGGDSASYQQLLGPGLAVVGQGPVAADRAVVLEGTVPEPPAILLTAMALVLLPLSRRFRLARPPLDLR